YNVVSGTSTAAAHVAGLAAFMKAAEPTLTNGVIVFRIASTADPAGTQAQTGNGRINMARALASTAIDSIQPAGTAPVGNGGPFVGPYVAAAEAVTATWNLTTQTITATASALNVNKTYQISYEPPSGSTTFRACFTNVTNKTDSLTLSGSYPTGSWTVR